MSKSPRQKKKLKLKVTKRGKRRNTKGRRTRLSNNRKVTMKKRGGMTPMGLGTTLNTITPEQFSQLDTFTKVLAEDVERRAAFIIREIYHILRKEQYLKAAGVTSGGTVEILALMFNPQTVLQLNTKLDERSKLNKKQAEYLSQMYSSILGMTAPSTQDNNSKEPGVN